MTSQYVFVQLVARNRLRHMALSRCFLYLWKGTIPKEKHLYFNIPNYTRPWCRIWEQLCKDNFLKHFLTSDNEQRSGRRRSCATNTTLRPLLMTLFMFTITVVHAWRHIDIGHARVRGTCVYTSGAGTQKETRKWYGNKVLSMPRFPV